MGEVNFCLDVYPCGPHPKAPLVAAYVRVVPGVLWREDWSVADISFAISVTNHLGAALTHRRDSKKTFEKNIEIGCAMIPGQTKMGVVDRGWINDADEMCFTVELSGDFTCKQPIISELSSGERLWVGQKYADAVVSAENQEELQCHCSILATASPVFERMFSSNLSEGKTRHVIIKDASSESVRTFVEYMYTDKLPFAADFPELLRLADMYQVPALSKLCGVKMVELVTPSTVVQTWQNLKRHRSVDDSSCCEPVWKRIAVDLSMRKAVASHVFSEGSPTELQTEFVKRVIRHLQTNPGLFKKLD
jgi:hypothetical protein